MLTQSLHSLEGENLGDHRLLFFLFLHGKQKLIGNKKRHRSRGDHERKASMGVLVPGEK